MQQKEILFGIVYANGTSETFDEAFRDNYRFPLKFLDIFLSTVIVKSPL